MKLRAPATPLITVDPYFSLWCADDKLNGKTTEHWTGKPNTLCGTVTVDGEDFRFMGNSDTPQIPQIYSDVSALVTDYCFANDKIVLNVSFYTPLMPNDLYRLSRPISYLKASFESADGEKHSVTLKVDASEEFCIDRKGSEEVVANTADINSLKAIKIGSKEQKTLNRSGDDLRIEWGYFYLVGESNANVTSFENDDMTFISVSEEMKESEDSYVLFAYDDIHSLVYFGETVDAYWKKDGKTIEDAIGEAYSEKEDMLEKSRDFSEKLYDDGETAGGEKYADLITIAYRQVIAAHKIALTKDGEIIFISKECFSNGCAATVDVTYPSSPMFLLYNTELLKGMLRPVFRFALSDKWEFDFAPHDVGQYPLVNGQVYGTGSGTREEYITRQMPVEECGNMIVMMANICFIDGNTSFFDKYEDTLEKWVKYLISYGEDPENQLCTDDFAGHLAHNCNLSLKAIMGVEGFALVKKMKGNEKEYGEYHGIAQKMAESWCRRAANEDGSFRLAFDKPDTFSMKYNVVWDKLWKTNLFPAYVLYSEFASNKKHFNAYGMPLDNRKTYTKSDWLVWTATLAPTKEEFEEYITPMWNCFNVTPSRVPLTDWYDTVTSEVVGFRHRSVQGGLFIKLLEDLF